ncbi:MAG: NUDIX hydrolase [Thermoleophilia bacterium]
MSEQGCANGNDALGAEVVSSRRAFEGQVISVRVDEIVTARGTVTREVVEHAGAVVVAAVDAVGRVVLARQYRHAVGGSLLELPAGGLEPGESPPETARRELREEAGLAASNWTSLGSFFASPGFLREELHAFLAMDLSPVERDLDDDEDIDLLWVPLAELLAAPRELRDAKTLATLLLVERRLESLGSHVDGEG